MNKHAYRKQWLIALKDQEGSINKLALKLGTDPNYISSILGPSGKRKVGDSLARQVEKTYSLPQGVLDYPSEGTLRIALESQGLDPAGVEDVIEFIRFKKGLKN